MWRKLNCDGLLKVSSSFFSWNLFELVSNAGNTYKYNNNTYVEYLLK